MGFLLNTRVGQLVLAVILFCAIVAVLLLIAKGADSLRERARRPAVVAVFAGPALLLLAAGLIYPFIRTLWMSFMDNRSENYVGFANYVTALTEPSNLVGFRNTFLWVILTPLLSTTIGLVYAVLIDKSRLEKVAKALLFLPMAISFVGAGIIWKFVYDYKGAGQDQIGVINALLTWVGLEPVRFLQDSWMNTIFLILVLVWIEAGFAMVILSASIKAVPEDIIEAARLDGASAWQLFWSITIPSIRPSLVVVLTTISIATLKIFDITRTMTGAKFDTQVLANLMYDESFVFGNNGLGSAMAVFIFVLVVPLVMFNIRQMAKNREVRG
ncbi:carbohydrate ABC transporter permease [Pseudactinotalea terrae]|uniref:carbohydrate ABC transporter permease n=1 Tax=Pseudactinotalea terrae TaxID=1743262 RepID=UPI0012E1EE36|nr:sugar ABC transporter permease [Pseudactinotalea terrae]